MLTSKQRSTLKAYANSIEPIFQLGKGGITENFLRQLSDALDAREIVKLTVLNNADCSAKSVINGLAEALKAEPVLAIGNKVIIYRKSLKKEEHIKL